MSPPRKKKTLKARHPTLKKPAGPVCPLHQATMTFNVEHVRWECPQAQCNQIAFPESEVSSGKPIMGRGQLEVFIMRDPGTRDTHYLLRAADNNVMLDISDYIESFNVAVVGASMRSTLTLHRLDVVDSRP